MTHEAKVLEKLLGLLGKRKWVTGQELYKLSYTELSETDFNLAVRVGIRLGALEATTSDDGTKGIKINGLV